MSYIYKISNDINDKLYIGKTNLSIQERFKEHCRDSLKKTEQHRPLYSAMLKYGVEHFKIELIEECSTEMAGMREQYWIGYYDGYKAGYNATLGGEGKQYFSHEEIAQLLKEKPYPKEVAEIIGCSVDTVYIVAKEYNLSVSNKGLNNLPAKHQIKQYDKQTNEYIQSFDSIQSAAEWLYNHQKIKIINSGVRSHISEVANGLRKTAYGYIWKY